MKLVPKYQQGYKVFKPWQFHYDSNGNMIENSTGKSYVQSATNGEDVVVNGVYLKDDGRDINGNYTQGFHQHKGIDSSPLTALDIILHSMDDKNPNLITGTAPVVGLSNNPLYLNQRIGQYIKASKITPPISGEAGVKWMRKAFDSDELFMGGKQLEQSIHMPQIQGHGIAKASTPQEALGQLRYLLDNGPSTAKTFFTGPLSTTKGAVGIGTASGMPYTNGLFIVAGKPGQAIKSANDIKTVLINDGFGQPETLNLAKRLQQFLNKTYPDKDAILYSEATKYFNK